MLKRIALGFAAVLAVLVVVIATRPAAFHIERSAAIPAPPAAVFPLINDFHGWQAWSPWEQIDPNMSRTYAGNPQGEGATYAWAGNSNVGEGRMTIVESKPNERVVIRLEFLAPFEATNRATFDLASAGDGTTVTWAMDGENGFMGKAFALFADMDSMIGADFDKGLAAMREAVADKRKREAAQKPQS